MTYEKIFAEVKKSFAKADVKKLKDNFAFQFNITGDGEGIFYACFKDGVLSVEPFDYKDRDVIFTADAKTITAVAGGKLSSADAIKSGKLAVDGNYALAGLVDVLAAKKAEKPAAKKPAAKAAKAEAKPAAKTAKPAAKAEAKPAVKAAKPAAKTEAKPAVKAAKPAAKAEAKPAVKAAKPTVKTEKK